MFTCMLIAYKYASYVLLKVEFGGRVKVFYRYDMHLCVAFSNASMSLFL